MSRIQMACTGGGGVTAVMRLRGHRSGLGERLRFLPAGVGPGHPNKTQWMEVTGSQGREGASGPPVDQRTQLKLAL